VECNQRHNAHIPYLRRVHYPYHPLHGQDVTVVQHCGDRTDGIVVIALSDGSKSGIPKWMLDPIACSAVTNKPKPQIDIRALGCLRQLLDAFSLPTYADSDNTDALSRNDSPQKGKGENSASEENSPIGVSHVQRKPVEQTPRGKSSKL